MSEQELNAILEEIKNRGKTNIYEESDSSEEINFDFNSVPRRSRRERIAEEEEEYPSQIPDVPKEEVSIEETQPEPELVVEPEPVFETVDEPKQEEKITFEIEQEDESPANDIDEPTIVATFVDETIAQNEFDDEVEFSSESEYDELPQTENDNSTKKRIIISAIIVLLVAAFVATACFVASKVIKVDAPNMKEPATELTTNASVVEPVVDNTPVNPLTGEHGYNENAIGKRPVSVVVENEYSTESVRPQWGLSDADIVLEGESEYSTRLLLFWADYTTIPKQVGPARSARPPFIRFSELFNTVFIHAGLSRSKGDYVGADAVFESDNVDHINLLQTSGDGTYFGRDKSRTSTVEHTGYLNGTNVSKMLDAYKIKTDNNAANYTQLSFNSEVSDLSTTKANSVSFKWSGSNGGRCPKLGTFTYNEDSKKYTTTDFDSKYGKSGAEWENLIFLLDTTTYVEKHNYKGSHTEIYCNYSLSGGKGMIVSNGTAVDITWGVKNKKLWFKDANGNEVKLNPGKTYIGYGSQNHGGYVKINDGAEN